MHSSGPCNAYNFTTVKIAIFRITCYIIVKQQLLITLPLLSVKFIVICCWVNLLCLDVCLDFYNLGFLPVPVIGFACLLDYLLHLWCYQHWEPILFSLGSCVLGPIPLFLCLHLAKCDSMKKVKFHVTGGSCAGMLLSIWALPSVNMTSRRRELGICWDILPLVEFQKQSSTCLVQKQRHCVCFSLHPSLPVSGIN